MSEDNEIDLQCNNNYSIYRCVCRTLQPNRYVISINYLKYQHFLDLFMYLKQKNIICIENAGPADNTWERFCLSNKVVILEI